MAGSGVWNLGKGLRLREVATIIDVGTNRGTFDLYAAFPDAYLVLIEPVEERIPDLENILSRHRGRYVIAAAGAKPGTATLNVEARRGLSSLLTRSEMTATGKEIEPRTVAVTTLDTLHAEHRFKAPIGIKIDTEGYELEVVRGARTSYGARLDRAIAGRSPAWRRSRIRRRLRDRGKRLLRYGHRVG